jgi:hypothetical protein
VKRIIISGVVLAGAVGLARRLRSRSADRTDRWLVVTVNCAPENLSKDALPAPLAALRDRVEIQIRPAPGGRGTELGARLLRSGPSGVVARITGADPRQEVRSALREAKSLLETGEVLRADTPSTNRPTVGGKILETATRRAGGEGRL